MIYLRMIEDLETDDGKRPMRWLEQQGIWRIREKDGTRVGHMHCLEFALD